jgi:hypothetical protein
LQHQDTHCFGSLANLRHVWGQSISRALVQFVHVKTCQTCGVNFSRAELSVCAVPCGSCFALRCLPVRRSRGESCTDQRTGVPCDDDGDRHLRPIRFRSSRTSRTFFRRESWSRGRCTWLLVTVVEWDCGNVPGRSIIAQITIFVQDTTHGGPLMSENSSL